MRHAFSPLVRITASLVLMSAPFAGPPELPRHRTLRDHRVESGRVLARFGMTLTLVLLAQAFRIIPDVQTEALLNRKRTVEALTIQLTSTRAVVDRSATAEVLDAVVERGPDVLSAALRDASGKILVEAGNHEQFWQRIPDGRSTAEFVRAPIYSGDAEVGAMEVRFAPLPSPWALSLDHGGVTALLLFVTVGGALGYFCVLRRSLRALDLVLEDPGEMGVARALGPGARSVRADRS